MSEFYRPQRAPQVVRKESPWKGALLSAALFAAMAAVVLAAVSALKHHPRFAVIRVVLDGVPDARRAEVEELTDRWIGGPLLFVDLDGPIATLSARSWVLRAAARRVVPDTIEVMVTPNPPVALARKGGELYTVDRQGNWLGPYAGKALSAKDDFVLLDSDDLPEPERAAGLMRGAALVARLAAEDPSLLSRVSEIAVQADGFALVDHVAKARLLLAKDAADPGRASAIWRVFLALRPEMERHGLPTNEADLRFEDRIVLKHPAEDSRGKT